MRRALLVAIILLGGALEAAWAMQQTPGPAPTEDRVGFPEGYETEFTLVTLGDRWVVGGRPIAARVDAEPPTAVPQVRRFFVNDVAASVTPGGPWPYGSVLIMETNAAARDAEGNLLRGPDGGFQRGQTNNLLTMRKGEGFGVEYGAQRAGEWEFAAYRPDGSYATPPQASNACAACHATIGEVPRDYVFHWELAFVGAPLPTATISNYAFAPQVLRIKPGTTVVWQNADPDPQGHTVTARERSFDSGTVVSGRTYSYTFAEPGTFDYSCSIHSEMRATVVVES